MGDDHRHLPQCAEKRGHLERDAAPVPEVQALNPVSG